MRGLQIIDDFISEDPEEKLMSEIDSQEWNLDLKRRTQHYGYRYDYKRRTTSRTNEMPRRIRLLAKRVERNLGIEKGYFNSCIINEYTSKDIITPHIDHPKVFDEIIVSVSLKNDCCFIFSKQAKDNKRYV